MCEIVKVTDFGKWLMVKAGNMKLSFEKSTGTIVNVSGGGCPDIPYLHAEMVKKPLPDDIDDLTNPLILDEPESAGESMASA